MVPRARMFARLGFTTVIHSARDHGNSSPKKFMNAVKFAEDIEAVIKWVGEPVRLYGHSESSTKPGYKAAVKAFLDKFLCPGVQNKV